MINKILQNRLKEYSPANALEQENVLQELMHHYVLASLSRARLFSRAAFHGGTCLRILYGTNRFSQDLDFVTREPDSAFTFMPYLEKVREDCAAAGIRFEYQDRAAIEKTVRKVFLKTDSIGQIIDLELPYARHASRKWSTTITLSPWGSIIVAGQGRSGSSSRWTRIPPAVRHSRRGSSRSP